jgi:hypothetical protein
MDTEKLQEGVLCELKIGRWLASKKINLAELDSNIPQEIVRGMQDLVEDKTLLRNIATIKRKAKGLLKRKSLNFPIDGIYWVPKAQIESLDKAFNELKTDFESATETLIENMNKLEENFKAKYPDFYNPRNYPNQNQLRAKFHFGWQFFQFALPDKKAQILSADIYKREREKFEQMAAQMNEMAINVIGNTLLKRVEALSAQCENETVSANTVKSFESFMERWDSLWSENVDSQKLRAVIKSVRVAMKRTSYDKLKDSDDFREKLQQKMTTIANEIKNIPNFELRRKLDV